MPRRKRDETRESPFRPARTSEERELQLTSLAMDLAEEQILDGSASSQVITHFLKAGSMREQLEQQRIAHEVELMQVKARALARESELETLMQNAIGAMRRYSGQAPDEEYDGEG